MDIVSRLRLFIDSQGLSTTQFADAAGIARPTLSQFLTGRNKKMSSELMEKLLQTFPQLNINWLVAGVGEMIAGQSVAYPQPPVSQGIFTAEDSSSLSAPINSPYAAASETSVTSDKTDMHDTAVAEDPNVWFAMSAPEAAPSQPQKRVRSIMVFYSDNSYEQFVPAMSIT